MAKNIYHMNVEEYVATLINQGCARQTIIDCLVNKGYSLPAAIKVVDSATESLTQLYDRTY